MSSEKSAVDQNEDATLKLIDLIVSNPDRKMHWQALHHALWNPHQKGKAFMVGFVLGLIFNWTVVSAALFPITTLLILGVCTLIAGAPMMINAASQSKLGALLPLLLALIPAALIAFSAFFAPLAILGFGALALTVPTIFSDYSKVGFTGLAQSINTYAILTIAAAYFMFTPLVLTIPTMIAAAGGIPLLGGFMLSLSAWHSGYKEELSFLQGKHDNADVDSGSKQQDESRYVIDCDNGVEEPSAAQREQAKKAVERAVPPPIVEAKAQKKEGEDDSSEEEYYALPPGKRLVGGSSN